MKTWKFLKVSEIYDECIVKAETLEEAKQKALDEEWERDDEPMLIKEQYKVVESSGDIYDDYDLLMEEDWNTIWDINDKD